VFRRALCSLLLPPFGTGSVTIFRPAPLCASPSQKPACGAPAQASSHGPLPSGIESHHTSGTWKRMPRFVARQTFPGETAPLAPAIQPLERQLAYGLTKLCEGTTVIADAKVVEVTAHLASQCLPEVGELADISCLA
jgi:hypothetical protein